MALMTAASARDSSTKQNRKSLGAFYTPDIIAKALARWAIRLPHERVLDPSFGGCAFLSAAFDRLKALKSTAAASLLFGVDIDPQALRYTESLVRHGSHRRQFTVADFFEISPARFSDKPFDVVLGNPPYVRHHLLKGELRTRAEKAWENSGVPLAGRASYWAYFLLHSLSFLARGGRLAFVLPGAFLHAHYANAVRTTLVNRFRRILIVTLHERVFRDAQEESVIVLGEGYGYVHEKVEFISVANSEELHTTLSCSTGRMLELDHQAESFDWRQALVSKAGSELYSAIARDFSTRRLGELAKIRIGTVTGANDYFILSPHESRLSQIPQSWFRPVVSRSAFLQGLTFTPGDWQSLAAGTNRKVFLLDTNGGTALPASVLDYLKKGIAQGVHERYKCRQRVLWHSVPICAPPDAFLQYMVANQPKLIINSTNATSTNSIHAVSWRRVLSEKVQASLALSVISSLGRLSAERVGRSYGGGVLKLEPGEAAQLLIVVPEDGFPNAVEALSVADSLLRQGKYQQALFFVDDLVLRTQLGLNEKDIGALRQDLNQLQQRRLVKKHFGPPG